MTSQETEITLVLNDGYSFIVPEAVVSLWEFFSPILEGRWSNVVIVDFSLAQIQFWNNISDYLLTNKLSPLRYEDVIEQINFFNPKSERWMLTVIVDDNTFEDDNDAKKWYEIVGYSIRDEGIPLGFIRHTEQGYIPINTIMTDSGPVYNNFTLVLDPVYNFDLVGRALDLTPIYKRPYTQEMKEMCLKLDFLNILTGIMNSAYLKHLLVNPQSPMPEEIDWTLVSWKYIGMFVKLYFGLSYLIHLFDTQHFNPLDRLFVINMLGRCNLEFVESSIVHNFYPPTTLQQIPYVLGRDRSKLSFTINSAKFSIKDGSLTTNINSPLKLYSILNHSAVQYMTNLPSHNTSATKLQLSNTINKCGLLPLTTRKLGIYQEKFIKNILLTDTMVWRSEALVPAVNYMIIYQGAFNEKISSIPSENFSSVIQYGLATVGSEAMEDIAALLSKWHKISNDKKALQFATLVREIICDRVIEPSRLP